MTLGTGGRWWAATATLLGLGVALLLLAGGATAESEAPHVAEVTRWLPAEDGAMKRVSLLVDTRVADPEDALAAAHPGAPAPAGVTAQFATFAMFAPEDLPATLGYDSTLDPPGIAGEANLALAAGIWNAVPGQSFSFVLDGASAPDTPTCNTNFGDGVSTVLFSNELAPGVLGETCSLFGGSVDGVSRIVEVDIHFSTTIPWSDAPVTPKNTFDLPTVMLHELGHAFGLDHAAHGTVMQPSLNAGTQLRTPTQDDIDGMRSLYGTVETPTPTGTSTATPAIPTTPVPTAHLFRSTLGSLARD
jgi:hypothetical protein